MIPIILLTLVGSIVSLIGGLVLLLRKMWSKENSLLMTSFAAGALLATTFFDLLPEALHHLEEIGDHNIFSAVLFGILSFFLLERTFLWFHHHHDSHGIKPTAWLITIGDGLHNFLDGVAIASSYLISPTLGVTTALAVAAHEIPQEIADFGILLTKMDKKKAIIFNLVASLSALLGAILTFYASRIFEINLGLISAFTAGMFMYIALSDLIPELHHDSNRKDTVNQVAMFFLGLLIVYIIGLFFTH